jgi:hypothetical protein
MLAFLKHRIGLACSGVLSMALSAIITVAATTSPSAPSSRASMPTSRPLGVEITFTLRPTTTESQPATISADNATRSFIIQNFCSSDVLGEYLIGANEILQNPKISLSYATELVATINAPSDLTGYSFQIYRTVSSRYWVITPNGAAYDVTRISALDDGIASATQRKPRPDTRPASQSCDATIPTGTSAPANIYSWDIPCELLGLRWGPDLKYYQDNVLSNSVPVNSYFMEERIFTYTVSCAEGGQEFFPCATTQVYFSAGAYRKSNFAYTFSTSPATTVKEMALDQVSGDWESGGITLATTLPTPLVITPQKVRDFLRKQDATVNIPDSVNTMPASTGP